MTTSDIDLVRGAWDAFSRGDVTTAIYPTGSAAGRLQRHRERARRR